MVQTLADAEKEMSALCVSVKRLTVKGAYAECEKMIADAMGRYPHAPQPHNLMGVLFEMREDRASAMKHFRAAWSLDPTYIPARHNLDNFTSFHSVKKYVFDENDLP